jgi:hypothetical protein
MLNGNRFMIKAGGSSGARSFQSPKPFISMSLREMHDLRIFRFSPLYLASREESANFGI